MRDSDDHWIHLRQARLEVEVGLEGDGAIRLVVIHPEAGFHVKIFRSLALER